MLHSVKRITCLKSKYMSFIINSEYDLYSYQNFASILEENDLKDEFGIDSNMLNQEPVSRDCHAIKSFDYSFDYSFAYSFDSKLYATRVTKKEP